VDYGEIIVVRYKNHQTLSDKMRIDTAMLEDSFEMDEAPTRKHQSERGKSDGRWMGFDELGDHPSEKPDRYKQVEYVDYEETEDYKLYSRRDPKRETRKHPRRKDKWAENWDY
jgi:hypothetical protein